MRVSRSIVPVRLVLVLALTGLPAIAIAGTQQGTGVRPVVLKRVEQSPARVVAGDEIDAMEQAIKPPARFASHRPQWRVEWRTFTYKHYQKSQTKQYRVVWDGENVVAVLRSGDIMLTSLTPDAPRKRIDMPTERLHLDNLLGPSFPIWQFIQKVDTHGSIYKEMGDRALPSDHWEVTDTHLILVRRQSLPDYDVEARFIFSVDPIYGYRVDGVRDVYFREQPKPGAIKMGGGTFTPGCYVPWREAAIYNRTVYTPADIKGYRGWANNLLTMDRCDANKKKFGWRDGGFITYLPERDGWSPCFTRKDGTGDTYMSLCNAHNDFHSRFALGVLPKTEAGRFHFHAVHRLLALPPEMTANVWDNTQLICTNQTALIIKVGQQEDFEQQPVPLTEPARGLVWTSGAPRLVEGIARSGEKSILITGRSRPNLPQVSLQPDTRYRLEAWMKVEPWTAEQLEAAKQQDARRRERLAKANKPLPPATDWNNLQPRAYIEGAFFEWSPYSGKMLEHLYTNDATPGKDGWQHVVLDFTAPDWGPFIDIIFHARHCNAYMDDFALRVIDEAPVTRKGDANP